MARIIGGLGIAHAPSMGHAYDRGLREGFDPRWQRWYEGTRPVKDWLARMAPTQLIVIYNDHLNHFDFDAYPTFAIGIGERFAQADEGWGPRDFPDLPGDPDFGIHVATSLVRESDFDLTVCQRLCPDHGIYSWFPYVQPVPWPVPVTPIPVNMVREPLPTARRLVALGRALRQAVESWPRDDRVLVMATGGMSHQISGARFGIANQTLDRAFLQMLPRHLDELAAIPQSEYMRIGGTEAVELTMWFAMRAALSDEATAVYRFHTFPQITGCGVLAMSEPHEEPAAAPVFDPRSVSS